MKRGWQVASLCLLALFAFAMWLDLFGLAALKSRPLPLKDALGPGPGFFPFWLSLVGLVLGALLILEVRRQPDGDGVPVYPVTRSGMKPMAFGLCLLLAVVLWKFPTLPVLNAVAGEEAGPVRQLLTVAIAAFAAFILTIWPNRSGLTDDEGAFLRMLAVIGLLAIAAACLEPLGFRLAAMLFSGLLLAALGIRSTPIIVTFMLCASLGVFHIFYYWLKVPLPIGPFDYVFKVIGL